MGTALAIPWRWGPVLLLARTWPASGEVNARCHPQAQAPGGFPGTAAVGQVSPAAPRLHPLHEEQVSAEPQGACRRHQVPLIPAAS